MTNQEETDNPYELERLALIRRNRDVLASMGLLNVQPPPSNRAPRKSRKNKERTADQPASPPRELRRSKRAQGVAADTKSIWSEERGNVVVDDGYSRQAKRLQSIPISSSTSEKDLKDLNKYRLSYMSEVALRRRIKAIRKVDKMVSFVQVLWEEGRAELAREAEEALQELLGAT